MNVDVAVIGAGIAGASIAAELDPRLSVALIEAEEQPGFHATGRSAAFWDQCYGGPLIEPLTTASYAFLAHPDGDFHDRSFLANRGVVYLARDGDLPKVDAFLAEFQDTDVSLERVERDFLDARIPRLSPEWRHGVHSPDTADIDVAALHQAWLRKARRNGVYLLTRSTVMSINRAGEGWVILAGDAQITARIIVNAAGAWADDIAALAAVSKIGLQPFRRTVVQARVNPQAPGNLPLVIDMDGQFYFKPDTGGRLWISPHDEVPSAPCDAAPEELDVALALDRFTQATGWKIEAVERRWAGLRSFAPDRLPVLGFDHKEPGFFWCAGQGGFGIQTAPAIAVIGARLIDGNPLPEWLGSIDPARYAPARFWD